MCGALLRRDAGACAVRVRPDAAVPVAPCHPDRHRNLQSAPPVRPHARRQLSRNRPRRKRADSVTIRDNHVFNFSLHATGHSSSILDGGRSPLTKTPREETRTIDPAVCARGFRVSESAAATVSVRTIRDYFTALWSWAKTYWSGILLALGVASFAVYLLVDKNFWVRPTEGTIFIETPQIYTRERLVNDRFVQAGWLRALLQGDPAFAPMS